MADEPKAYIDYSEAISKGVFNWMEAHKDDVLGILKEATGSAVEFMGAGTMAAVSKFLTENSRDLTAAIATAIAAHYVAQTRERKNPLS